MTRPVLFYLLAAVVPAAALWLAAPTDRAARGMAVSPFGWPSLLVVQALSVLPLAGVIAAWLVNRIRSRTPYLGLALGVIAATVGSFAVHWLADLLEVFEAGFALRCVLRSAFCLLLAVPWGVAAHRSLPPLAVSRVMLAVGLVAAVVLPGIWANKLAREVTAEAQDTLAARRMARALPLIEGVCDLDPGRQIVEAQGNLTVLAARQRLAAGLKEQTDALARLDPARLPAKDRLAYAEALLTLDRAAEAEPILRELARKQPAAHLPLARALQQLGRYGESDAAARELLAAALPDVREYPEARRWCRDGFDLLAENATRRGANADREAVLKEGLERVPGEQAYFHFQLGRHYCQCGRPVDAVRELNEAVRLNGEYEPTAGAILRDIRESTPACLIGR